MPEYFALAAKLTHLERRTITTGWLPDCMLSDDYDCYDCPLVDCVACPVRQDGEYRSYLQWLRDRYVSYQRTRHQRIEVLKSILTKHGLPLHWEVLAELALDFAPGSFDSPQTVRGLVFSNPGVFHTEGEGVFGLTGEQEESDQGA